MTNRIYIVTNTITDVEHIVRADSQAQAVRRVANELFTVSIARPLDVARLMAAGAPYLEVDTDTNISQPE